MKILMLGSLNLDYVYEVDHFVQPGETLTTRSRNIFCGGKGLNQSISCARAGAQVFCAGRVGTDGTPLIEQLTQAGVDASLVEQCNAPGGHTVIQIDKNGQNCILYFGGTNQTIDDAFTEKVLSKFDKGDLLLLQNEISNLPSILRMAHARGLQIAFNLSPIDETAKSYPLELVDWFLINEVEGFQLTGEHEPQQILDRMFAKYPDAHVLLTLGSNGAIYADRNGRCARGIYASKVVDTTAAGDTFTGFFLSAICRQQSPETALDLAARASSLAVAVKGAANSIPTLATVEATDFPADSYIPPKL